jgi:hypothetical protein
MKEERPPKRAAFQIVKPRSFWDHDTTHYSA